MPTSLQLQMLEQMLLDKEMLVKLDEETKLKSLHFIFHDNTRAVEMALDIIEKGTIMAVKSFSCDRCFWRVSSSNMADQYVVLNHHCACKSFSEQFRMASSVSHSSVSHQTDRIVQQLVICKHLLAVKIATLLNRLPDPAVVSDDAFVDMMCNTRIVSQSRYGEGGGHRVPDPAPGLGVGQGYHSSHAPSFNRSVG
jgi:hypothetical protein